MNTEERLRAALEQRAATATRSPEAYAAVRRRGERRRWTYRLQAAGAAAAVLALVVGAAVALPGGDDRGARPAPPVTTATGTAAPTEAPSEAPPSATPSAYASPATPSEPAVGRDEYVALLGDGRLVIASARDGAIRRTVTTFPVRAPLSEPSLWSGPDLDLAPDRAVAYVTYAGTGKCDMEAPIERVDLATGERRTVARGDRVSVSPDGRRLAYVVDGCTDGDLAVRDLGTGEETRIRHREVAREDAPPWHLHGAVWHADGRRLWVVTEWEDMTELRLLDPATDRDTADATAVRAGRNTYQLERRGDALLFLDICCYPDQDKPSHLVLRDPDGSERRVVTSPAAGRLGGAQVGPDGDLLYEQRNTLYRLDLETGETTDLGESTAVARDW